MKKLISLLTSITLCVGAMSALPANAGNIAIHMGIVITQDELAGKFIVHKGLEELGKPGFYQYVTEDGRIGDIWQAEFKDNGTVKLTLWMVEPNRVNVPSDKKDEFVKYMEENHPDCTLKIFDESYSEFENCDIAYVSLKNTPYLKDEKEVFEFISKICRDTGARICLASDISTQAVCGEYQFLGDLSSDNALTPVDASMLLSYYSDAQSGVAVASAESGADYSVLGDFNGDGAVTPSDASEILSYYADQQTAQ